MNKKLRESLHLFVLLVGVALVTSCLVLKEKGQETTMPSYIPESTEKVVVGEHEWYYLISPTGRCYETTIRVKQSGGTGGYGFFGMSEIPCDEMPEQQQPTVDKNSEPEEPFCEN